MLFVGNLLLYEYLGIFGVFDMVSRVSEFIYELTPSSRHGFSSFALITNIIQVD
jgi:hypothetical protein